MSLCPKLLFTMLCATATVATPAAGQSAWTFGGVLDVSASSRSHPLGARDRGLSLGHSDVTIAGPLGSAFDLRLTGAAHTHERKLEAHVEEVSLTTRTLPFGLQLKAGRFASQLGYLNEQHPHADDFIERPLPYRAFFGQHWFDDGVRLNWTAPTETYLRLGAEAFRGRQLVPEAASARRPGVLVFSARTGSDLGASMSWQAGASWIDNRREAALEHEHDDAGADGHDHAHAHGAAFSGRRGMVLDAVWKWAPGGNAKNEQVRLAGEYVRINRPNRFARSSDRHAGGYLSLVYRFQPAWEAGVSAGWLDVRIPHDEHFHPGRLREASIMLAYKPGHLQSYRLQATRVSGARGFGEVPAWRVGVQVVLAIGAHPAHSY
ncbi:hypothetical protein [Tepidimonas sp.]|uniref:hypothetical protein n=1 Tax=Tepidimonas sp. TaxID=2002775 RepID=UPI002FE30343